MKKVALVSLGCDKNLVDSEVVMGKLLEEGFSCTCSPEDADYVILNTCAFIEDAYRESYEWIKKLCHLKQPLSSKRILVMGCLPSRFGKDLRGQFPSVDCWVVPDALPLIPRLLQEEYKGYVTGEEPYLYDHTTARVLSTPSHLGYLKIAEGCPHRCTFCVIPRLRGPLRSRSIESIEEESGNLAKMGVKEFIIVAQDIGSYGVDLYHRRSLPRLLWRLGKILPAESWLRLLYVSPESLNTELIEAIAGVPQVCRYLDIPLQHVDHDILKAMKRPYRVEHVLKNIECLRSLLPEIAIRTTFLTGFPGEGIEEHKKVLDVMRVVKFERLGAFPYSEGKDCASSLFYPKVPPEIARERSHEILNLQKKIMKSFHESLLQKKIPVIIEDSISRGARKGTRKYMGRTYADAPDVDCRIVLRGAPGRGRTGSIGMAKVTRAGIFELEGVLT